MKRIYTKEHFKFKSTLDSNGCWIWWGGYYGNGRPVASHGGIQVPAARLSLHLFKGFDLNSKLEACHDDINCKSIKCVNPDHLYAATHSDNLSSAVASGKLIPYMVGATHCKHGHEFTEENTYNYRRKRRCLICKNKYNLSRYYKSKERVG